MQIDEQDIQQFLDDISECFIEKNFEQWHSRISLPFSLITVDGPLILKSPEDLKANFEDYLLACDLLNLDKIYRRALRFEDCNDGTWIVTYETNLMSRGQRVTAPYTSSALMFRDEGRYKMRSILNARGHLPWTGSRRFMIN